jgi:hypothetical protein
MTRFPLRYAHGNVLIGPRGQAAGLYRLSMSSYPFLSVSEKWGLQARLEHLAHRIGADFSLWRVNRAYPAHQYVDRTVGLVDRRHQDPAVWRAFLEGHRERLTALDSHVPECYVAVSLQEKPPTGFGSGLLRVTDRVRGRVEELARIGSHAPLSASRLRELSLREQHLFERLSSVVGLDRARTVELQWLLRRAATRGIGEPDLDGHWQPKALEIRDTGGDGDAAYEPLSEVLWRCANCAISEQERTLTIDGEQGRSFQAILALGALGDAPQFPGAAAEVLFAAPESTGFPVDAVFHARWLGNRDALTQVRKRIADVENAYREQIEGSAFGPGLQAEEDRTLAREYEAKLQAGAHPSMLTGWISLAIGAPSSEELERRVTALREHYGDITLHRPAGLQHQLFFDHLPRPDGGVTRDYVQQVTVEQFGAMVATATRTVGSPHGPYLGYTPTGAPRPVRFDPTRAPREDRVSAVLLAGTLGSGKTVCAQKIAFEAERRGSLIVDFDPKPDHGWQNIPELEGRLQIIELSGDPSQQGKLDPLLVGIGDLREELACSYLIELLRDPPAAWENAISRAVKSAVREGSQSLMRVIEKLCESEQEAARDAGEALEVISDFGLARLGFGTGQDTVLQATHSVTTIRMPGLSLPDPHALRDTYTRSERLSVATLTLVAAYALRLISTDRSRHKVVLLDEIWFLLESPQGRAIINRIIRLGRAFNATLLLSTQLIPDLGSLSDLIGDCFIFGQDSDSAAERALKLISLDPSNAEHVRLVREQREGRCLMRDLDGRVEAVQVDVVHPHLLQAFTTTPGQPQEALK